jgi:hypothetical protein
MHEHYFNMHQGITKLLNITYYLHGQSHGGDPLFAHEPVKLGQKLAEVAKHPSHHFVFCDDPCHSEHETSCHAQRHIPSPSVKKAAFAPLSAHKSKLAIAPYEFSGFEGD